MKSSKVLDTVLFPAVLLIHRSVGALAFHEICRDSSGTSISTPGHEPGSILQYSFDVRYIYCVLIISAWSLDKRVYKMGR